MRVNASHARRFKRIALALISALIAACSPRNEPIDRADRSPVTPSSAAASRPTINPSDPANYRFLYVVYCSGRVDKLDLQTKQKLASIELSERSGNPPGVATRPLPGVNGDGCLARPVVSIQSEDMVNSRVNIVASRDLHRSSDDGRQSFQLLTFELPDWTLVSSVDLGRFDTLNGTPPYLAPDSTGALKPQIDPAPRVLANFSSLEGAKDVRPHEVVERSGDTVLMYIEDKNAKSVLPRAGVVYEKERRLVKLVDLPNVLSGEVRLAPGGAFVMRQINEATSLAQRRDAKTSNVSGVRNSGELRLYDIKGQSVATFIDKSIVGNWHCIALTPSGFAVYTDLRGDYRFVSLGRSFDNALVWSAKVNDDGGSRPGLVFHAR